MKQKSMPELILGNMVFGWYSAFYFAFIAACLWVLTALFFLVDSFFAIGGTGFMAALSTIGAIDMFLVNNLKNKSPVGRVLRRIGL